jgi:glycerol-3-phosphate dehydrogenase
MVPKRQTTLAELNAGNRTFDLIVIGGGITGAGVAREAAGSGLRALLVDQKDFAWGTSSRSSKMVHGGLRYLGSGQYRLTRDAVNERQRLMNEAPGLIDPLKFMMPHFRHQFPGPRLFQLLLRVYDWIARTHSRQSLKPADTIQWVPGLATDGLAGASGFTDAVTDDARLVQRLISEARRDGALCLNYVKAQSIERSEGKVTGVQLQPEEDSASFMVSAPLVINATGAWAGRVQSASGSQDAMNIRPLRGSHLVIPWARLPVSCSVSLLHPADGRPVFAFPWLGTTVLGTTDLDHSEDINLEPAISGPEVDYLLGIASQLFPETRVTREDIISTWAGVRPVITDGSGKAPSKENREHELQEHDGLISVAGGKLTTFRLIAREALERGLVDSSASALLRDKHQPVFAPAADIARPGHLAHLTWHRLKGYYGPEIKQVLDNAPATPDGSVTQGYDLTWAEVAWACNHEDIQHLDDLLLRRTRLGLVLRDGAENLLPLLKRYCQPLLGWSDTQWSDEVHRYLEIRHRAYSLPAGEPQHDN